MIQSEWYIVLSAFALLWLAFRFANRTKGIRSVYMGFATLFTAGAVEYYSVSNNLWNYTGGNWPWILWAVYFVSGMAGYEMSYFIFTKLKK